MPRSLKKGPFIDLSLEKRLKLHWLQTTKGQLKLGQEDLW